MKFKIILSILGLSILSACFLDQSPNETENTVSSPEDTHNATDPSEKKTDPVQRRMQTMTWEEKIGQMVIAGMEGFSMNENAKHLIEQQHIGGFILFKRNVESPKQLLQLLNALKEHNARSHAVPLFLSADEEGGPVSRMPESFVDVPSSKAIGQQNDPDLAYAVGRLLAQEIQAFGFNTNFAPVLDVNSNPDNPVIGKRAFGSTPEKVRRLGVRTMEGIQSQNIISIVKHFPGHGDTSVDSHLGLPKLNHDRKRLNHVELPPFEAAVEQGADGVMAGHILLPALDPDHPASMSEPILTDLLRDEMDYQGVILTDDMTMGAITDHYGIGEAAVQSVRAGSDIVLVCHGHENVLTAIQALRTALNNGDISRERINESVERILRLKQQRNLTDHTIPEVNIEKINKKIRSVLESHF